MSSTLANLRSYSHGLASFLGDLHSYSHRLASFLVDLRSYSHGLAFCLVDWSTNINRSSSLYVLVCKQRNYCVVETTNLFYTVISLY